MVLIVIFRREWRDITTNCGDGAVTPPNQANTTGHLSALRANMAEQGLAAYYVPYDAEGRREWISGFTGSNGDAIVTSAVSGDQVTAEKLVFEIISPVHLTTGLPAYNDC